MPTSPAALLSNFLGRRVTVKFASGEEFRGVLASIDGSMNVVMEQTEEFGDDGHVRSRYGDAFIRGSNIIYVSASRS